MNRGKRKNFKSVIKREETKDKGNSVERVKNCKRGQKKA
jgi:hypothetical protein